MTENEQKIEQLKKEWADEVSKIKEESTVIFNHAEANKEYDEIKEKYLPQILELMRL